MKKKASATPPYLADFARPLVAVDLVVFTILDADLKVLLIQRDEPPFKSQWALPGGFVRVGDAYEDQGEDLETAAHRELAEETGLPVGSVYLEQLYTFGKAQRDPRTRVFSVTHYALVRPDLAPFVRAGGDAAAADWLSTTELSSLRLAFDHLEMIEMALQRIRGKLDYTNIAFELVPPTFSIAELRSVYEIILGKPQDPGNFRRRFHRMIDDGLLEEAPGKRLTSARPAKVFRFCSTHMSRAN
ncbi:MAG: NUDIX hydrolase [Myxococcales bacterium]|nr:NUDIX hydrolase [Myxococcales bacterium]MCB9642380.1 NUDIX hydrolase [Myxococcales bacterium]